MKTGVTLSSPDLRPSLLSIVDGLLDAGLLEQFATSFLLDDRRRLHRLLRSVVPPLRARHRQLPERLRGRTHALMRLELLRAAANRISPRLGHWLWWRNETTFDRRAAARFAGTTSVFCGVEHAALASFQAQRRLGGRTVLRQVIAHADDADAVWRRAYERAPRDFADRPWVIRDLERTRERKLEEYALSDRILANSDFVRDSFIRRGFASEQVVAIPTGCPPLAAMPARAGATSAPLRFLFVGGVGHRKGVDVLVEAWRGIAGQSAELLLAGSIADPVVAADAASAGARLLGHLDQDRLQQVYREADVFVLPSRLEGLSHSLLEALSFGLPVIATAETGAGRFVVPGHNGWIVANEDAAGLRLAMQEALDDRQGLQRRGAASRSIAASWTRADATAATIDFFRVLV